METSTLTTPVRKRGPYKIRQRPRPNRAYEFRKLHNLKLIDCAAYVGVKPPTIHKFETIGRGMGTLHLLKLSELLGCDLALLLSQPDQPPA